MTHTGPKVSNVHFVTVVWGDDFTSDFLDVALPSFLAQGNLPDFCFEGTLPNRYHIYTTDRQAQRLESHPVFQDLKNLIDTRVFIISDIITQFENGEFNLYTAVTMAQRRAMKCAVEEKSGFVFLPPDIITASGFFPKIAIALAQGKQIVTGTMRVNREDIVPLLRKNYRGHDGSTIEIAPRELIKASLPYLHEETMSHVWTHPFFNNAHPSVMFWRVGSKGLLLRAAHLHPLLTYPRADTPISDEPGMTIDGSDYIEKVCPNFDDIWIVSDSDELGWIGLGTKHPTINVEDRPCVSKIAAVLSRPIFCRFQHRFLDTPICLHSSELDEQWQAMINASEKVLKPIRAKLDLLDHPATGTQIRELIGGAGTLLNRVLTNNADFKTDIQRFLEQENREAHQKVAQGRIQEAIALLERTLILAHHPLILSHLATLCASLHDHKTTLKYVRSCLGAIARLDPPQEKRDTDFTTRATTTYPYIEQCAQALCQISQPKAAIAILDNYVEERGCSRAYAFRTIIKSRMTEAVASSEEKSQTGATAEPAGAGSASERVGSPALSPPA